MILALVGAAFILGKIRESETRLDVNGIWKFSIITASPGLVLALLGTILMITTIVTHFEIAVEDAPVYTGRIVLSSTLPSKPLPIPNPELKPKQDDTGINNILNEMQKKTGAQEITE